MMRWESLILETTQLGGSLVFIEDQAPSDVAIWLESLSRLLGAEVPFVKRRAGDLLSGALKTRPEDLVILYSSQLSVLAELNQRLQGQRLLFADDTNGDFKHLVDFVSPPCSHSDWTQALERVKNTLKTPKPIEDYAGSQKSPCLFLDRDDVVVKNVPYNKDASLVELMPGICELLSRAHKSGYWVSLVTNQSGLGRGWVSWQEYQQVHQKMLSLLAEQGCWIDECVWAGYYDQESVPQGRLYAAQRKPRNGMFQRVHDKLRVNLSASIMVGDSATDLIAAFSMGVRNLYLLASDKTEKEKAELHCFQKENAAFKFSVIQEFKEVIL